MKKNLLLLLFVGLLNFKALATTYENDISKHASSYILNTTIHRNIGDYKDIIKWFEKQTGEELHGSFLMDFYGDIHTLRFHNSKVIIRIPVFYDSEGYYPYFMHYEALSSGEDYQIRSIIRIFIRGDKNNTKYYIDDYLNWKKSPKKFKKILKSI